MSKISYRVYLAGLIAILLLAAAMRFYHLTADAPIYLTRSQDLNTDGPNTIGFARDWVLFGVRPLPYLQPALTGLAYLFFSTLGVGYWQANLIAVTTSLLAIVFIAAFAHQHFGREAALLSALFMALNFPYLIYNRTPMVYTPLTLGLALALFCWGKGLRRARWFFLSGLISVFCVLYIKIAGITFLAAAGVGLLILTWQRRRQPGTWTPLLFFLIGGMVMAGVGQRHLFQEIPVQAILPSDVSRRTFNPGWGFEENIRFALVSLLQFGIYSGFFGRVFPLFALAYGYLGYRGAQLLGKNSPRLPMSEIITLLYLIFTVLMLLASNNLPYRFMIGLVPPMSLTAALALKTWLHFDHISLPARFGRIQLVFVLMGGTYFVYQFLAAAWKLGNTLRLETSLVDYRVIMDLPLLFALLIVALVVTMLAILVFIWWLGTSRRTYLTLPPAPTRLLIALLLVVVIALSDLYQYWDWAKDPHFSIVTASRQITEDVAPNAFLGGSYAYVLALENQLHAKPYYATLYSGVSSAAFDPEVNYLVFDADSVLKDAPFNDERMHELFPEYMKRAKLLKSYTLRGYLIKVYTIEP